MCREACARSIPGTQPFPARCVITCRGRSRGGLRAWGLMKTAQVTDWSSAYSRFRPDVLSFLSRRLWGRQELAEDLAQETFARALKAGTPIRDPSTI